MHSVFSRTDNDIGIAAGMVDGELRALTMIISIVVLVVVIAIIARHRLSRQYAVELEQLG